MTDSSVSEIQLGPIVEFDDDLAEGAGQILFNGKYCNTLLASDREPIEIEWDSNEAILWRTD